MSSRHTPDAVDLDLFLAGVVAGDADAFARWLAGAEPPMRESLRSFAAHVDVEAVLQEALLRVWQVAPRIVPDGRPQALLRVGVRIARNLALDEARRLRASVEPADLERAVDDASLAAARRAPDPLLRRAIEECRAELPPRPAEALTARLAAAGAEPDEAVAARLGMRKNTFLQNFGRARRLLAECLQRRGIDPGAEIG
jgi:DNA-directed RNA polymerase specialized sigma24 family protein